MNRHGIGNPNRQYGVPIREVVIRGEKRPRIFGDLSFAEAIQQQKLDRFGFEVDASLTFLGVQQDLNEAAVEQRPD